MYRVEEEMAAPGGSSKAEGLAAELGVEDLYVFLDIPSDSTQSQITTAYRRKARKFHPDKNPDDPRAADLFDKLSKAHHILTDPAAKAAYDKWLKAKFAAKKRHEDLNVKRRKLKESLESREHQSAMTTADVRMAAKDMEKELARLREEGRQKIKEQEELLRQQFLSNTDQDYDDVMPTLKVTWKTQKIAEPNGGYNEENLKAIFSQIGRIHHVLVSSKKKGKALVSFHYPEDAEEAMLLSNLGHASNPLSLSWVCGQPGSEKPTQQRDPTDTTSVTTSEGNSSVFREQPSSHVSRPTTGASSVPGSTPEGDGGGGGSGSFGDSLVRPSDYESVTLMRLRQAEERRRLAQQLQEQQNWEA